MIIMLVRIQWYRILTHVIHASWNVIVIMVIEPWSQQFDQQIVNNNHDYHENWTKFSFPHHVDQKSDYFQCFSTITNIITERKSNKIEQKFFLLFRINFTNYWADSELFLSKKNLIYQSNPSWRWWNCSDNQLDRIESQEKKKNKKINQILTRRKRKLFSKVHFLFLSFPLNSGF